MMGGSQWQGCAGASPEALEALREAVGPTVLPDNFYALLALSNGGEGSLSVRPLSFILDPAEEIARLENEGTLKHFFPDFLVFGGDGAGELFALDIRDASGPYPVIVFDMTNIDLNESVATIAPDFDQFLALLV